MKLGVAAAQKDLDNAVLALKRARSDLSTAVRTAYFTVLVDVETLIVTRALAQFTDDVYRIQTGLLRGTVAAPYEPASLRAQAYMTRLAYKQAIFSYMYDWKALVATIGLQQLPLTAIAGRVDRFIPYYDYDTVLAHVLKNHTDILTARNGVVKAQHLLRLAQVTPLVPDLDVRASLEKDFSLAPFGTYQTLSVGFPIPIWDQNKGNIIAAQAALVRASEESHRVEVTLANSLASAYSKLQEQPGRPGGLPSQYLARPGPLLPGHLRAPPDRPQLGLWRPGGCAANLVDERHLLHRRPRQRVDLRGGRGGLLADRRLVPTGAAA